MVVDKEIDFGKEIKITDRCKCGHTLKDHGYNDSITTEELIIGKRHPCKAIVGWVCLNNCRSLSKHVRSTIVEEKEEPKTIETCTSCGAEVSVSECQCTIFRLMIAEV